MEGAKRGSVIRRCQLGLYSSGEEIYVSSTRRVVYIRFSAMEVMSFSGCIYSARGRSIDCSLNSGSQMQTPIES